MIYCIQDKLLFKCLLNCYTYTLIIKKKKNRFKGGYNMSAYAYRDRNRTEVIYASEAMTENIDTLFFCPNKDCNAHLHICAVDGSRKAYFRATHKQFPHIDNCPFASSANHFDSDKFNEEAFSFDDAINNHFLVKKESERNRNQRNIGEHNNGEPNKQPIKT